MKLRKLLITLPLLGMSVPAIAQDAAVDTDGDGQYSFPELQVAMPEMAMDSFTALDANGDGLLDADEIAVAVEAGILPAQDG